MSGVCGVYGVCGVCGLCSDSTSPVAMHILLSQCTVTCSRCIPYMDTALPDAIRS